MGTSLSLPPRNSRIQGRAPRPEEGSNATIAVRALSCGPVVLRLRPWSAKRDELRLRLCVATPRNGQRQRDLLLLSTPHLLVIQTDDTSNQLLETSCARAGAANKGLSRRSSRLNKQECHTHAGATSALHLRHTSTVVHHVFHKGTKPFLSGKRQSVFSPLFAWRRFWCLGTNSVTDMPSNVITSLDTELTPSEKNPVSNIPKRTVIERG